MMVVIEVERKETRKRKRRTGKDATDRDVGWKLHVISCLLRDSYDGFCRNLVGSGGIIVSIICTNSIDTYFDEYNSAAHQCFVHCFIIEDWKPIPVLPTHRFRIPLMFLNVLSFLPMCFSTGSLKAGM